jgi:hypothetical protein
MRREFGDEHLTSFQSRSEAGENDFSSEDKISPILMVPKNPVVAAAQITCLSRAGHEVAAILLPNVIRRGRVTTLLVFGWSRKFVLECSIPLMRSLERQSSDR